MLRAGAAAPRGENLKSDTEQQQNRWFFGLDKACDIIKHLIKWVGIGWVAWCLKEAVSSLAGVTTLADINVGVLVSLLSRRWVTYSITVAALLWAWRERRLRMQKIKHFSPRIARLERSIDPDRSSSRLTSTGRTRPEDK